MKGKQLLAACFAALAFSFTNVSIAATKGSYHTKLEPFYYSNTLYLVPVDPSFSHKAECQTRPYLRLENKAGESTFDAKFAIILAAWMAQKELKITGTGTCSLEGDEVIRSIRFNY